MSSPPQHDSLSALPSPAARIAAFVAILAAGAAGGLIGYSLVRLQCDGACGVPMGIGLLVGAIAAAAGTAVVAVLVLRALGEWRQIQANEAAIAPGRPIGNQRRGRT